MNNKGRLAACLCLAMIISVPHSVGSDAFVGDDAALCSSAEASIDSATCAAYSEIASQTAEVGAAMPNTRDSGVVAGSRFYELFFGKSTEEEQCSSRPSLIVGGGIFGTRITDTHVTVSSTDEDCALKVGDKIISIDGKEMRSAKDVRSAVKAAGAKEITIVCQRGSRRISIKCTPKDVGGEYRLGAALREGASGIGTVTYVNPKTGEFGGLGHGICDPDTGEVIEMTGGSVTDVILGGVVKGEDGKPGELTGILTDRPLGEIYSNTASGVFGRLDTIPKGCGTLTPIAYRSEVHEGDAKIISTLKNGATMEYTVKISDVNSASTGTKCFKVKVTDPALLAISGGIVRGMSGSPIIQDGKLVGAVTHVLVADPSSGYGIFIENMLSTAKENTLPRAA